MRVSIATFKTLLRVERGRHHAEVSLEHGGEGALARGAMIYRDRDDLLAVRETLECQLRIQPVAATH
jgi:hypothetical protein